MAPQSKGTATLEPEPTGHSEQTPDKEVKTNHLIAYVSGYIKPDQTLHNKPAVWVHCSRSSKKIKWLIFFFFVWSLSRLLCHFCLRCSRTLTFRHRASCILGQAFHYSPENAFYIQGGSNMTGTNLYVNKCKQSRSYLNHLVFNQQIYFII